MPDSALSMKFVNFSKTQFDLDYHGYLYQKVVSGPGVTPGPNLAAHGGTQSMTIDQMLSALDQGPLEIFCCWRSPTGFRFGVKLHANFQMFGLGYRPVWYVMSDNASPNSHPNWSPSDGYTADPYTWKGAPFSITATPNSGHTSLSLSIQIEDIS